jgi:ornithine--oxo-acid transaminase
MIAPAASAYIALEQHYGAHNYASLPVVLSRGEGVYLWDVEGHRYLDMMSAYSAVSFGHSHPRLVQALVHQAGQLAVCSRAFHTDRLGPFLQALCAITGMARALPMNTGAEAVETALKAARKWGYLHKHIPENQAQIIVAEGNFAGRTTTLVSFSSEPQYRAGFGPFTPGFVSVPFGDAPALEAAITPHTCAFLVEPIQGEAGIIVPPEGYLRRARALCDQHQVLLICDEVQTGLGRTGTVLACDHEGVRPDGLTLGKALGGGLLPVSAFLASEALMQVFEPGDHGSTFGGNPLAAAVGLEALQLLQDEHLTAHAAQMGHRLMQMLQDLQHPAIREVRGRGLLVGIDIDPAFASARTVCEALAREGVLSKDTHHTVLRFAPPLVIQPAQLEGAVAALERALQTLDHLRAGTASATSLETQQPAAVA